MIGVSFYNESAKSIVFEICFDSPRICDAT